MNHIANTACVRSHARVIITALAFFVLAGCAQLGPKPDVPAPQVTIPDAWSNGIESNERERAATLATWWQKLADPLLDDLIVQAMAAAPDLRRAEARLRQARANRDLAIGGLFPTVTTPITATRSRAQAGAASSPLLTGTDAGGTGQTQTVYSAGFDASWEIDVFGGIRSGIQGATADVEASAAAFNATRVSLAVEIALDYVALRAYQRRVEIATDNLASQAETLQITTWRAQAGLTTSLDVEQARTTYEQTRASIPGLQTSIAESQHSLEILLGRAPGSLANQLLKVKPLPSAPGKVAVGIPANTLRQRPDVRAAERSLAAEAARTVQQRAARYPTFSLDGFLGSQAFTFSALGGTATFVSTLAGTVSATIFDGGRIRSRIAAQSAVEEQALIAYEKTILTALEDVENAIVAYYKGREQEAARLEATAAARNAAVLARNLYEAGLADFQRVLDTQRTRLTAEEALVIAQANVLTAVIQLYKALGGGWNNDEAVSAVAGGKQS